jgi:hypothetical protein
MWDKKRNGFEFVIKNHSFRAAPFCYRRMSDVRTDDMFFLIQQLALKLIRVVPKNLNACYGITRHLFEDSKKPNNCTRLSGFYTSGRDTEHKI